MLTWKTAPQGAHADLMVEVQEALNRGDTEAAIVRLRELVRVEPDNRQGLSFLANLLIDHGVTLSHGNESKRGYALLHESAKYMKQLRSQFPQMTAEETNLLQLAFYNDACAEALNDHVEKALKALKEALDAGYNDLEQINKDPDFNSIRDLPGFKQLLDRLRPM